MNHILKINEDTEEVNTIIFDRAIAKHSMEIYLEKDNKEYYTMILRHEAKELINFLKEEFDL